MARLSRTGSRVQGFQRIAAGEVTRRQDMQEGLWFGDGPGVGMIPTGDLRMAAISNRVADEINMTCFTPPLGGAGFPGTHRCLYQRVTVVRACTISLVEMGFMYPPVHKYPPVGCWAQVSIYANDGAAGGGLAATPSTLLARCVPIPLAALSTDDSIDFVLPLWEPIEVLAGTILWIAVSPKAYHAPAEAVHTDENGAYYIDARGTRTAGDLDFIRADTPEPPIGNTPGDWIPYDDLHLWVRLYEHPEALALQNSIGSPPPTSRVGIRSIIKRPVEGELESAFAGGIRPGMGTLPWDEAGGAGAGGGGGGGATGNVNAPLALGAGEVVYATGANTVATDAGFTFDPVTGIAYATALQTAQNVGIPGDADLVQFAADEAKVNGVVRIGGATDTGISFHSGIGTATYRHGIHPETLDGADDHLLWLGGGAGRTKDRGAFIWLAGNEYGANNMGRLVLSAGDIATAGLYDGHITFHTGGALRMNLLDGGDLEHCPDADKYAIFGRMKVGFVTGVADVAALSHFDHAAAATYALSQIADGSTFLNTITGKLVSVCINNAAVLIVGGSVAAGYAKLTAGTHTVANAGEISINTTRQAYEWYVGGTPHMGGAMVAKDVGDDRITGGTVVETTLKSSNWQAALDVIGRTMVFDIRGVAYSQKTGAGAARDFIIRVKLDGNTILEIEDTYATLADHAYSNWWARVTIDFTSTSQGWVSAMGAFSNPTAGGHPMQQGYPTAEIWSDDAVVASDSPLIVTGTIAGGGGAASFLSCWKLNAAVEQV